MSNRTTLAQLAGMTKGEVSGLPLDHLAMLLEDVDATKKSIAAATSILQDELERRFAGAAAQQRAAAGKDAGTVTLVVDGFKVRADLPKKVEWDQVKLEQAVEIVQSWGEQPGEYVSTEIKVSETKYNAWPSNIRKVFEPARTLGVGKPSYKLEREAA